jgi:hypothetical protein
MPHREFVDPNGVQWQTWDVRPRRDELPNILRELPTDLGSGWLAFQSEHERRRIAPIPEHWESLSDVELLALLANAKPLIPRKPAS